MHSLIAYGIPKEVQIGGPGGRRVNAIGWLAFNGPSAGERLFTAVALDRAAGLRAWIAGT